MIAFIVENLSTILVSAVVLAVVILILLRMRKNRKKNGAGSCNCGCSGCPSASVCHKD